MQKHREAVCSFVFHEETSLRYLKWCNMLY